MNEPAAPDAQAADEGIDAAIVLAKGHFATLTCERDELCSSLRKLAEYAERVVASGGAEYLLHLGI